MSACVLGQLFGVATPATTSATTVIGLDIHAHVYLLCSKPLIDAC